MNLVLGKRASGESWVNLPWIHFSDVFRRDF